MDCPETKSASGHAAADSQPGHLLVGKKEAAELLGVAGSNLYRDFPELPEPVQRLAATPLWRRADIEALAKKRLENAQK